MTLFSANESASISIITWVIILIIIIIIIASPAKLRKGKVAERKGKLKKSTVSTVHKEHWIVLSSGRESDSDD